MAVQPFNRHFSFESFSCFLSPAVLEQAGQKMKPDHRQRCLGLTGFIWLGLFVAAHTSLPSLQEILDVAGQIPLTINCIPLVSVSAFCQYRAAFSLKVLLYLWRYLRDCFSDKFKTTAYVWRGLRLRALDGTSLNLPEQLYPYFGASGGLGPGPVQGFMMLLYDLAEQVPVAFRLGPANDSSQAHLVLKHLMHHLEKGDLVVIDAGLYSIEIFSLLLSQNIHFIIPMPSRINPKLIRRFSPKDGLYQIMAGTYWADNPLVQKRLMLRVITYQQPGFRSRRLLTSLLDEQLYPADEIGQNYHRRWEIETFFRDLKSTLQVTHWHAQTLAAIYSELVFQMLLVTLTRLVMADAAVNASLMPNQLSFASSVAKVRQVLRIITSLPLSEWSAIYQEMVARIQTYLIDIRPGRHYERDKGTRRKRSRSLFIVLVLCYRLKEKKICLT